MRKKRVATVWLAGCSGCHMSLLDIDERILEVAKLADIVKSPIVDGKELSDCDVVLVEGAVGTDEHLAELLHIRKEARILVSLGDCAVTGNVSALRNIFTPETALRRSYIEAESNVGGDMPKPGLIGKLLDRVRPLHEVVSVDFHIPGCPPSADLIFHVLFELLNDRTPHLNGRPMKFG